MKTHTKPGLMSLVFLALLFFSSLFVSRQVQANFRGDADISIFHDALAPYGTWINHQTYGQVWYPNGVDKNWRPYTDGHWAHTEEYGWLWVSNQSWGWAPFHYGRWFLDNRYGWIWVPGQTWAPAWVFWRSGGGYAAWAPMPPNAVWQPNRGLNTHYFNYDRDLSRHSWIAVHDYDLPNRYISRCFLPPRQNVQIFHVTNYINQVTVIKNTIVNIGVPVKHIEQAIGYPVPPVKPIVIDDIKPIDNGSSIPVIIQPKDITSPGAEDIKKDMALAKQLDANSPSPASGSDREKAVRPKGEPKTDSDQPDNTPPTNTDPPNEVITNGSQPPLPGQSVGPLPVNNPNPTPVNGDILPPAPSSAPESSAQAEPTASAPKTDPVQPDATPPANTDPKNEVITNESQPLLPEPSADPLPVNNPDLTPVNGDILPPASSPASESTPQAVPMASAPDAVSIEPTAVNPEPLPSVQPESPPVYQAEPQPQSQPSYQAEPQPQSQPSYQPEPQPQSQPSYQAEPQPAPATTEKKPCETDCPQP
jgi:hypothetical protein